MRWTARARGMARNQMSLFYTLFGSFIAVILLLVSINSIAYGFFRDNIKKEIILNSSLNLQASAANYEKHIKLIRSYMLGYLFDNNTQILKRGDPMRRYDVVIDVQKGLQHDLNNSLLYLDNIIYYFKDDDFVIERDGTRNAETMFSKFYNHPSYTADFWNKEMDGSESFRVYPAGPFRFVSPFEQKALGTFIPILVKNAYDHRFAFIVLLNANRAFEAFHQFKPDSSFFIVNAQRQVLFSSAAGTAPPPEIAGLTGEGYVRADEQYYFYRTSADTGFTYFEVVSNKGLAEQLHRLNLAMGALIALSILFGLIVSYWFSKRFHNPLANLIRSVQSRSAVGVPAGEGSRIKEFNLLQSTLSHLSRSNQEYHQDLLAKNNLLQQFAYMTRLKKIQGDGGTLATSIDDNGPYRLVLSQIEFKDRFAKEIANAPQRAFNMYRELINAHFSSRYDNSFTFQLEKDQILSILFVKNENEDRQEDDLDELVRMLGKDIPYCNFTLAISPVRHHSADFAETYQNVLDLIKQRRLGEDVQVIGEWIPRPSLMIPSPSEEQELTANLQAGGDDITIPLVDRLLDQLNKAGALAYQFQDFAADVVNRTIKIMYAQNVSIGSVADGGSPYDQLKSCHTLEQYKAFFHKFLARSAAAIQAKKSETDIITKFVMEYVEAHYGEDLSLDVIAGKLGITGPYLSTYYKEKTGTNFSDYIFSVRMNKATEMLRETDLKIQEIASLVGYYTVASFNRVFKRYAGITPSEYRRQHNQWRE
ncbi:helix-turn-helix domain-containing protein [Cohnella thailandensis]|uniref:Helix-turn-helix transcriptional regulator n=1 Tax=Cohnella thailandensis TaxID=557557 RepID=A0A841T1Q6_9BACL|nr:AraC family transcriptional regulator [Cohnella thailandensis]MBB6635011.1 helix-turn-helix transcriptional regulator [Cohnella thailandensis]MBP1975765.1 YesN/AraC family two-component response regulator [Cohnella thailandensis]